MAFMELLKGGVHGKIGSIWGTEHDKHMWLKVLYERGLIKDGDWEAWAYYVRKFGLDMGEFAESIRRLEQQGFSIRGKDPYQWAKKEIAAKIPADKLNDDYWQEVVNDDDKMRFQRAYYDRDTDTWIIYFRNEILHDFLENGRYWIKAENEGRDINPHYENGGNGGTDAFISTNKLKKNKPIKITAFNILCADVKPSRSYSFDTQLYLTSLSEFNISLDNNNDVVVEEIPTN